MPYLMKIIFLFMYVLLTILLVITFTSEMSSASELILRIRLTLKRESGRLTDTQAGLWLLPASVKVPKQTTKINLLEGNTIQELHTYMPGFVNLKFFLFVL